MDKLKEYRVEINQVDQELLKLFRKRLAIVRKVGELKKKNNLLVVDKKRERELLGFLQNEGEKLGIRKEFIRKIWKTLFKESYLLEEELDKY